jgi:hypothetical protein
VKNKNIRKASELFLEIFGYLIVITPALGYWVHWYFYKNYWSYADPTAWYFLDSLSIFSGGSYKFLDHPGTPVQIIGSFLLALTLPFFESRHAFIEYHIANPELFFNMTNLFLLFFNSLTSILLYRLSREFIKTYSTLAAIAVALSYYAVNDWSFVMLTYWQHNALYFTFGALWWIILYKKILKNTFTKKDSLVFGFFAGVLAHIQVFFIPFIFSSIIASFVYENLNNESQKRAYTFSGYAILGNLIGILSMIIPVYQEFPRFIHWIRRLIFSEGLYGDGAQTFFTFDALSESLFKWKLYNEFMIYTGVFLIAGCIVGVLYCQRYCLRVKEQVFPILISLLVHIFILIIFLTKVYAEPRFSLSLAAIVPILFIVFLQLTQFFRIRYFVIFLYFFIFMQAFGNMQTMLDSQYEGHVLEIELAASKSAVVKSFAQTYNVEENEIVILYAYGTPLKCAALTLANDWLGSFDKEISRICPNQFAVFGSSWEPSTPKPLIDATMVDWDILVFKHETFLSIINVDPGDIKYVPGRWGIEKRMWFFVRK